ncbi:MAG: adenosylmethionine-8-amino-7-oxononanoate aminotransferase [Leptospiraceae bacterium]|nr:MAG: adenosylmethionine-8-amino-7-oxononanoate aminotransferase [Leptospiraceae bacterium]
MVFMDKNQLQYFRNIHKQHIWWPFTPMKLAKEPFFIEKGEGVYLYGYDYDGNSIQFIDAISSWWVSIYGHNCKPLKEAIKKQLDILEHVIYASMEHEPALKLAKMLSEKSNHTLSRVFYSDDGSTAMEIAAKMAYQYFQNQGLFQKKTFFVLENGYHGDTFGTMSLGARSDFHKVYEPLLFNVIHIPMSYSSEMGMFDEQLAKQELQPLLKQLDNYFEKFHKEVCGIVIEPLIQGAAGMLMYHPIVLKKIRELCDNYNIFMICDEVFTGAGRTGPYFAYEHAGIYPDILALSKGLPAGYATFAVTMCKEKVYQGFYSDNKQHTLFHGHSMTGNPIGCAISISSIELYEQLDIKNKISLIEKWHKEFLEELKQSSVNHKIKETRYFGSVAAVVVKISKEALKTFNLEVIDFSVKNGALIRPLGNILYIVPPYIIEKMELKKIYEVIFKILKEML